MHQVLDMFSLESEHFELLGVRNLSKVLQYKERVETQFISGVKLASDLESDQGVTLYTAGTKITHDKITRLIRLQENNPEWDLRLQLCRSEELVDNFRKEIVSKLKKLTKMRYDLKIYKSLLGAISEDIDEKINELLSDENFTLQLYKMKYITDSSDFDGAGKLFNHGISVAIFAYAISKTKLLADKLNFADTDSMLLLKSAFFHNIGAVMEVDYIMNTDIRYRETLYHEESRKSDELLIGIVKQPEILKIIKFVNEHYYGSHEFTKDIYNAEAWIANIILVADLYLKKESGLFSERVKPALIIDDLNIRSGNGEINQSVVDAITYGLGKKNIGDFYKKINEICGKCGHDGGGHARPYPFKGFKSPTIFVCKNNKTDCENFEKGMKAVTLVTPAGNLGAGKYSQCKLTSSELQEFYLTNKMFLKS